MEEFVGSDEIKSENGRLLQNVIERIMVSNPLSMPKEYKVFLEDVSKATPVAGYIQVTHKKPLELLEKYCLGENIRNVPANVKCLESQLPVILKEWIICPTISKLLF